MKKIILTSLFIVFIFSNSSYAIKLEKNETYSGLIKKIGNVETSIILPNADWELVATIGQSNTISHMFAIEQDNQVAAIIWLFQPTGVSTSNNGFPIKKSDNGICFDYDGNGPSESNHTRADFKLTKGQNGTGRCFLVSPFTDIGDWTFQQSATFNQYRKQMKRMNISYPDAMIWIDNTLLLKNIYFNYYIGVNPAFASIESTPNQQFMFSDWYKRNIQEFPEKDNYMKSVIRLSDQYFESHYKNFNKRKPIDFTGLLELIPEYNK